MAIRKISHSQCFEGSEDLKVALQLDFLRAKYIVKKKNLAIIKSYKFGALWNILDPMLYSLVYLFVFIVIRFNTNPSSLMIGIVLIRGLQQCLVYGASSNLDFTAGLKIERMRTRVIVFAELLYISKLSFYHSIGCVLILLIMGNGLIVIPLIPILSILNGLFWYSCGRMISPQVKTYPDILHFVKYFGMLMFFGSPALYPLSQTRGLHRLVSLYNPFTYFVEPARWFFLGDKGVFDLIPEVGFIVLFFFFFTFILGIWLMDKQRWKWSVWS